MAQRIGMAILSHTDRMTTRFLAITRFSMLEALRTRLPLLTAIIVLTLLGASFFIREIAIAESTRFQTAFYASTVRYATVFVVALYVIASISREFQDKGLELVLALDLARGEYIVGKLLAILAIAGVLSVAAGLPLFVLTGAEAAAQWTVSLVFELSIVVAMSLFCVMTFNQIMPAASVVIAFYLLARAIIAIRLISANPIVGGDALSHRFMTSLVESISLVVPGLELWTRTTWLVDEPAAWSTVGAIVAHAALFVVVLAGAAVFDFYRKNF
jgi:ABC-type transport system involved in multi-copper enzyme maturation permease subunit